METKVKRLSHPKKKEVAPEGFIVSKLARPDRGAVDEQDARKRARETSRQTGQRIPDKKSPTSRSPHNSASYPVNRSACYLGSSHFDFLRTVLIWFRRFMLSFRLILVTIPGGLALPLRLIWSRTGFTLSSYVCSVMIFASSGSRSGEL